MTAWYQYPSDAPGGSYGQIPEPFNNSYKKPDVNIAVPSGVPITSAGSGVVTSVQDHGKPYGGLSVVVALDQPLNNEATHVAYNYLGGSSVNPGDNVAIGQQLGTAGSPYGVNFALGLTSDNSWGNGTFNKNASGDPNLDPHILLQALLGTFGATTPPEQTGTQKSNAPIVGPIIDWLNQQKNAVSGGFKQVWSWLDNPLRIIKLGVGIMLIGLAILLLLGAVIEPKIEEKVLPMAKEALMEAAAA